MFGKIVLSQATEWREPLFVIRSEYGKVTIQNWLEKEKRRIEKDPTRFASLQKRYNLVALFVGKKS